MRLLFMAGLLCTVILSDTLSADSCQPAEEGTMHNISCTFNETAIGSQGLPWTATNATGLVDVSTCYFGECHQHIPGFRTSVRKDTSILTIFDVSRTTPFNVNTKWQCQGRTICNTLQVYARASNVRCVIPPQNASLDHVTMECTTDRIFPEARCTVLMSTDNISYRTINQKCVCSSTPQNETLLYYRSDCSLAIALTDFRTGNNYVKVSIYPNVNVKGAVRYGVESDGHLLNLDINTGVTLNESPLRHLVIGLGVALAIVTCLALLLGIMTFYYRRKSLKDPPNQLPASPFPPKEALQESQVRYNELDRSQADVDAVGEVYEEVNTPAPPPPPKPKSGSESSYLYGNEVANGASSSLLDRNRKLNFEFKAQNYRQCRQTLGN